MAEKQDRNINAKGGENLPTDGMNTRLTTIREKADAEIQKRETEILKQKP